MVGALRFTQNRSVGQIQPNCLLSMCAIVHVVVHVGFSLGHGGGWGVGWGGGAVGVVGCGVCVWVMLRRWYTSSFGPYG